jgi:hypothetical protein
MSTTVLNVPEQGQLLRVRSRQWVVNEVKPSKLPPPVMKPSFDGVQSLITLASVEDDGLGEKLQVVWEVESGPRLGGVGGHVVFPGARYAYWSPESGGKVKAARPNVSGKYVNLAAFGVRGRTDCPTIRTDI